ncbi:UDP-2,3-diacylglucosamine diphosphatase [Hoeflea sp. G2-23]|uniref:UDP-2,3-diacylglucosamine diphosphatase n=1 Tax=Hoeflea algicola TaxID=2983763 RepID=A0ABT3Z6S0_9HYPH|nr:UDP-2,3-diacylglucosamine diphosphatase [Hoeflea algicola]MCY0147472.1 UDP-2,3-diacylglucosamine diphosphatase [Hoeflea algicola]
MLKVQADPVTKSYRTIFLSDIHLGTPDCQADLLIEFLRQHDAETIYLVGDIVDCWRMKRRGFYWPQSHNDVVQKLLRKARKGTRIIYVPGNHDELLRDYQGVHFGGIEVRERDLFETADGKRLLVIHGDEFDMVVMNHRWLAHLGDIAYGMAMWANKWHNRARKLLGLEYWSISRWAKLKVKGAVNFISDFEQVLADEARKHGADGVICGHIHHAANEMRGGVRYINTGDWVESCTAIVEHPDGRIELIDWSRRIPAKAAFQAQSKEHHHDADIHNEAA